LFTTSLDARHLLSLLKTHRLRRFFLAHFQSELGFGAAYVALLLVAYHPHHSGGAIALVLLAGVGTTMYRTTVNAALPGMVSEEQRSPATALYGMNCSIGMTIGPALTALVLLFAPATFMLAATGVTFLVSAAVLRALRIPRALVSPPSASR
jgi:hypothetical protein